MTTGEQIHKMRDNAYIIAEALESMNNLQGSDATNKQIIRERLAELNQQFKEFDQ